MLLFLAQACTSSTTDGSPTTTPSEPTPADHALCAPERGPFSADIDNPYLPFVVGSEHAIEGLEGGTDWGRSEHRVLDETLEIEGVTARVVEKRSYEEGPVLVEIALEYYAQAPDGAVCSYGEDLQELDAEGAVVAEEGWRAGEEGAEPGLFMPGVPEVGQAFTMVFLPPDDVERAEVTAIGDTVETPAGTFEDTVSILEDGPSLKHYARDVGMIYDDGMALVER